MQLNHYLNFQGQAEQAFTFYQNAFAGEVTFLSRYGDLPPQDGVILSEEDKQKIMHISLAITDQIVLMASDVNEQFCAQNNLPFIVGTNHYISINLEKHEQSKAYELFEKLSINGTIEMPLDKTFWGALYGAFTDQFGIQWMINCQLEDA
ncbi:VOC family protein [Acinetobacter shaoyimingii]|uniref:VOC family protein n=1 Tax=Acinetobacter shaoyimingii TaxID=2715164 RepID=A0A6G8RY65_9GAMM|nr:VOC family protein [Acinetobacter shaoyimingii]QIO06811.1 VOC family protein [Acinetobacter shaoyimingii]